MYKVPDRKQSQVEINYRIGTAKKYISKRGKEVRETIKRKGGYTPGERIKWQRNISAKPVANSGLSVDGTTQNTTVSVILT